MHDRLRSIGKESDIKESDIPTIASDLGGRNFRDRFGDCPCTVVRDSHVKVKISRWPELTPNKSTWIWIEPLLELICGRKVVDYLYLWRPTGDNISRCARVCKTRSIQRAGKANWSTRRLRACASCGLLNLTCRLIDPSAVEPRYGCNGAASSFLVSATTTSGGVAG